MLTKSLNCRPTDNYKEKVNQNKKLNKVLFGTYENDMELEMSQYAMSP